MPRIEGTITIDYSHQPEELDTGTPEELDIDFKVNFPELGIKNVDLSNLYVTVWRTLLQQIQDVRQKKVEV